MKKKCESQVVVDSWQNVHHCYLFQNINDQSLREKKEQQMVRKREINTDRKRLKQ
jgi:hypothetical protein